MQIVIFIGVALAAAGLGGVVWCILEALKLKKSGKTVEEAKPELKRMSTVNLVSVFTAFIGLAVVASGLILR